MDSASRSITALATFASHKCSATARASVVFPEPGDP
jgi:hypothetical protein